MGVREYGRPTNRRARHAATTLQLARARLVHTAPAPASTGPGATVLDNSSASPQQTQRTGHAHAPLGCVSRRPCVDLLVLMLGDQRAAVPPPAPSSLCAWAFEEGGSTASRWTPLPRPATNTGQGSPGEKGGRPEAGRRQAGRADKSMRSMKKDPGKRSELRR